MTGMSHDLWQQLGIAPTTDETAIRRAYAKRLREVRPDEDPAGFQRLVEARDLALLWLAQHETDVQLLESWEPTDAAPAESQGETEVQEAATLPASAPSDRGAIAAGRGEKPEWIAVLDFVDAVLRAPNELGWQRAAERIANLAIEDRAVIQPDLIQRLGRYADNQPKEFGDWGADSWPFFDLAAQLDAEFRWSEQDRIIHFVLPHGEAERFLSLLSWARNVTDVVLGESMATTADHIPRFSRADVYAFYDSGGDLKGLRAYRMLVGGARSWPASDPATDLFFPLWSLRDGRYGAAALGLLGWIGLLLAFVPWRAPWPAQALQWTDSRAGPVVSILIFTWPMWLAVWITLGSARVRALDRTGNLVEMPLGRALWLNLGRAPPFTSAGLRLDTEALFFFPFWAFGRGLHVRGIVGLLPWMAIVFHFIIYPAVFATPQPEPGFIGAIALVLMLHMTAGDCGQRWVLYKLVRTAEAADRAGLSDPAERLPYIRKRGTRDPQVLRKAGRALRVLLVYLLLLVVVGLVLRAMHSLHEGRW
jgi:hypothetical protein